MVGWLVDWYDAVGRLVGWLVGWQASEHRLCVQWESSPESDMLADSIVALVRTV